MPDPRSRRTWTLVLTSLAFFVVSLASLVVVTAPRAIHRDFGQGLPGASGSCTHASELGTGSGREDGTR